MLDKVTYSVCIFALACIFYFTLNTYIKVVEMHHVQNVQTEILSTHTEIFQKLFEME